MPTLFLIRHGENDYVGKRLSGRIPGVHLNEKGRLQAAHLAEIFGSLPLIAIYSSPLERAVETAQPLADVLGLPIQTHPGLLEMDYGEWQGLTIKQMSRRKLFKTVQAAPSQVRIPGGESFSEVQQRAVSAVAQITAALAEKEIAVCFSHADVIKLIVAHILQMPLDAFQRLALGTASITTLVFEEQKTYLINYNVNELVLPKL
jgi:probable phosphomutase (TIGR03848 family)